MLNSPHNTRKVNGGMMKQLQLNTLSVHTYRFNFGVDLPKAWGWKETKYGLFPVTTHKEPAPPVLLSIIPCECAKGCNLTCTRRKSRIKCSTICYHCKGQGCTNSPEYENIITNSANQGAEIDTGIEEIISEVDLKEDCQTLQVEESDSKQTDINDYDLPSTSTKLKFI
ncbi:hypothetical protein AVEN_11648-1 [Araneus ventricosus]|uniref:Tesmin/TSO1-like CXC domain-containing protein n=1 Tax=Araneus ventricosus TaxID=182803 RepID=A0A4Y2HGA6_ARAVE|nr:hypothetical protein AVEN_11648-1 [Araneus ventricosus]